MTSAVEKLDQVESLEPGQLRARVEQLKQRGLRFVTLTALNRDATNVDIFYHFGQDLALEHFRVTFPKDQPIPSISSTYLAAMLVENEIQDQFGVRFEGLAIDYDRKLLLDQVVEVPFSSKVKLEPSKS